MRGMAALCELSALTRNAARYFKPSNHDRHGHVTAGASGCTHNVEVKSHKIYSTIPGNGVKGAVASQSLSRFVCRSSEANAIISKDELFKDAAKAGDLNALRELVGSGEVDINLPSPARAGWTGILSTQLIIFSRKRMQKSKWESVNCHQTHAVSKVEQPCSSELSTIIRR